MANKFKGVIKWFLRRVARPREIKRYLKSTLERMRDRDFVDENDDSVLAHAVGVLRNLRPSIGISSALFEQPAFAETDLTWTCVHNELQEAKDYFATLAQASNRLLQANVSPQLGPNGLQTDTSANPADQWFGTTLEEHHDVCTLMVEYFSDLGSQLNTLRLVLDIWNENLSGYGQDLGMGDMLENVMRKNENNPAVVSRWDEFDTLREAQSLQTATARDFLYSIFHKQEDIPVCLHIRGYSSTIPNWVETDSRFVDMMAPGTGGIAYGDLIESLRVARGRGDFFIPSKDNPWYRTTQRQETVRDTFNQASLFYEQQRPMSIGKPCLHVAKAVESTPWPQIVTDHAADGGLARKSVQFTYDMYTMTPFCGVDDDNRPAYRHKNDPPGKHLPTTTIYHRLPNRPTATSVKNMLLELTAVYKNSPYFMVCEIIEARSVEAAKAQYLNSIKTIVACDMEQGDFQFIDVRRYNDLRPLKMSEIGFSHSRFKGGRG